MIHRIFIHGLESSNQGTKAVFFRDRYPDMILPTFEGPLPARMEELNRTLAGKSEIRIVGSSFGGLMAALFAMENPSQVMRMILLAPAINMIESAPGKKERVGMPVSIYHGTEDRVIPLSEVQSTAPNFFADLSFHAVDDDHFLHRTFKSLDWDALLA
ncbi:MAG: YqiA/YcfP family alpha/beta fold hydrolase [Candidatus Desulfacyla sp.]